MEQNQIILDIHWTWQLPVLFNQLLISTFHLFILFLDYTRQILTITGPEVNINFLSYTLGFNKNKPNGVYQSHPIPQSSILL